MKLWKTDLSILTPDEIDQFIKRYQREEVPRLNKLRAYYEGKNTKIAEKPRDTNNPDNRTPVPYGRKIVTTFTGYAYSPGTTSYKLGDETPEGIAYLEALDEVFRLSKEHIKTSRAGRNMAIYGVAYELCYIDDVDGSALPRFYNVDPREMILLYDFSPEPQKKVAIRFYEVTSRHYKVEVYYPAWIEVYDRTRKEQQELAYSDDSAWKMELIETRQNFFNAVPVPAHFFGDERLGVIEPVLPLIDDYDVIMSDSIDEFQRFANAYLLMVKMGLTNPRDKDNPGAISRTLQRLKRSRVFENLPDKDAVSFLTKTIPVEFISWMTEKLREQIHIQSHVPDFASERFTAALSGAAIDRLMFDFENVVSSAEADFDVGLFERIDLVNAILRLRDVNVVDSGDVMIMHRRNMPLNVTEWSGIAEKMKRAGFSRWLVSEIMPDDIVPDVEAELERQAEDMQSLMPGVDDVYSDVGVDEPDSTMVPTDEPVQDTALNGAQVSSLLEIIMAVSDGSLTAGTARPLIRSAFPGIADADIDMMLSNVKVVIPTQAPAPVEDARQ